MIKIIIFQKENITMKYILLICCFFSAQFLSAQGAYIPLNTESYRIVDRFDIKYNKILPIAHSGARPYNRAHIGSFAETLYNSNIDLKKADDFNLRYLLNDNAEWVDSFKTEKRGLFKLFYREEASFLHADHKAFSVRLNPVVDFEFGHEFGNRPVYMSSKGFELRATLLKKLTLYTFLTDNQARQPSFVRDERINSDYQHNPGEAYYKEFKKEGQDFFRARGYVAFNTLKYIDIQFGYDKQFIGDGFRSLLLSDNAAPFLFLKTNLRVWKINYQSIWGEMIGQYKRNADRLLDKKYAVFHHLNFNVTPWLDLGVFEAVSLTRSNQFEWHYLVPLIFFRSIEQSLGSPDNSMIGFNYKANFLRRFQLYGQFVMDEFNFGQIMAGNGWWANKFGIQQGFKYIDVANIPNLDFQLEYNMVMPYTYSHNAKQDKQGNELQIANFTHYNQALAHPLGANFTEFVAMVNYQPAPLPQLNLSLKYINAVVGNDSIKLDGTSTNYGSNLFENSVPNNLENEFGNYLRQGNAHRINNIDFNASYQFWHNMYGVLKVGYRNLNSDVDAQDSNSVWFSLGVRINASQRSNNF